MKDLQCLLERDGFAVFDRPTLAFFAIGKQMDTFAAAKCFRAFHDFANTRTVRVPNRFQLEQMEHDSLIEDFGYHDDGSFGMIANLGRWNTRNITAQSLLRKYLSYILKMVDYHLLKNGLVEVTNW